MAHFKSLPENGLSHFFTHNRHSSAPFRAENAKITDEELQVSGFTARSPQSGSG